MSMYAVSRWQRNSGNGCNTPPIFPVLRLVFPTGKYTGPLSSQSPPGNFSGSHPTSPCQTRAERAGHAPSHEATQCAATARLDVMHCHAHTPASHVQGRRHVSQQPPPPPLQTALAAAALAAALDLCLLLRLNMHTHRPTTIARSTPGAMVTTKCDEPANDFCSCRPACARTTPCSLRRRMLRLACL